MVRLQKVLADAGIASRRKCENLILEGRVSVDGEIVRELGIKVEPLKQDIRCDGVAVKPEKLTYLVLNKPRGYVCSASPLKGLPSVLELVQGFSQRLFTVGRLDRDSEGLLILTNDGFLSHHLAHPRHKVIKTYLVTVGGKITAEQEKGLELPVWTAAGRMQLDKVRILSRGQKRSELEVGIKQGKNREIRRTLAAKGMKVRRLVRTSIGFLQLGNLQPGRYRKLTVKEIENLMGKSKPKEDK